MLTSPLVRFHHSDFGFVACCHNADGVLYFDADDIFTMFGVSNRKPFADYIYPKEAVNAKNKSDFITEDGLNEIWRTYEPWFTSKTCNAYEWLGTEVIPIVKKMKVKPSPTSYTTADEYWSYAFAELFWAFVIWTALVGLCLRILP